MKEDDLVKLEDGLVLEGSETNGIDEMVTILAERKLILVTNPTPTPAKGWYRMTRQLTAMVWRVPPPLILEWREPLGIK